MVVVTTTTATTTTTTTTISSTTKSYMHVCKEIYKLETIGRHLLKTKAVRKKLSQ